MKTIYIIIGLLIVVVAILFFRSNKTEAPVDNNDNNQEVVSKIQIQDGLYEIDTKESKIIWKGEFVTGSSEEGFVKLLSGSALVTSGSIISGEFEIDMNSIESVPFKEKLVLHLKNDDFFSVDRYPTAKFVIKTFAPSSGEGSKIGRYVVGGNLTIRGIEKPISFMATVVPDDLSDSLKITGSFAINRADWEVKYNSSSFFTNLGDKIIRDAVEITLDLKAQKLLQ